MQENKSEATPPKEPDKPKMSIEQRQRQKKFVVYTIMVIACAVVMWLIFAPSEKEAAEQQQGFNTDVPAPTDNSLTGDKQTAYEQAQFAQKQEERKRQMQDLSDMFGSEEETSQDDLYYEEPKPERSYGGGGSTRPRETINASANAYRDINRTLGNFYETPKEDPEKEELRQKLEQLNAQLEQQQQPVNPIDDQIALMEKSYELAAKYLPQGQGTPLGGGNATPAQPVEVVKNGKVIMTPIGQVQERIVSGLSQPISDSAFVADYAQPRNIGFHTAVGGEAKSDKNTIKACVHGNQTIIDGQAVRLRLLEPMRAGTVVMPRNAIVTGMGKIAGERLDIAITTLEYEGMIIPAELSVYDSDGQSGIFIPGSMEVDAVREIAANLGGNLGTTINLNQQSAGNQLLTDLGKGAIQGTSQYIAKKMRTIKVHLKAGYNLMLYQNKNN
ncbi:conjugative transposon protein TraM [Bacteroides reticulotermitis]|uniref:conjugative transposon protein TraM n=1 Tax=Bacteroides reticulotermitis TaxID=1133319 RepID=UPI003A8358C9